MDSRARKPGRPKGPPDPRLVALQLDPGDEHYRDKCFIHGEGYAALRYQGKHSLLHRIITAAPPGSIVDHVNGDKLDNRRINLRVVTQKENMRNLSGPRRDNASGFLGVCLHKQTGKWKAEIRTRGASLHIGLYATPEEANRARLIKEKEIWGIQPRRLQFFLDAGIPID